MKQINLVLSLVTSLLYISPSFAGSDFNSLITRGGYLAEIMLCTGCHTPMTTDYQWQSNNPNLRLAGGMKVVFPPYGVFYSKNITPDNNTGIGQWNDEEILNAVQHGISKDGRGLRVMPYPWFSNLTKDDAKAIVEYLRSVPPINHKVPKNEAISIFTKVKSGLRLITPFVRNPSQDWYYGDYGVLIGDLPEPKISLFPEPQPITFTAPEAIKTSPQIEKGRYLVSISLCAGCHTPVSTRGFYEDKMLAGGFEIVDPACGTVYAQNLTPDKETGLGNWTDKEIIRAIKNGISKDGRTLCGQIMPYEFYTKFTDEDVLAIITYLKALKPIKHAIPDPTPPIGNEIPAQQFVVGDAGFVEVTDDEDSMDAF